MAVGGQRDVELFAIGGAQLGQLADEIDHALAQQRLAAGDADLLDSKPDQHARHAQIVGKRQVAVERALVPGAAVNTLVVAAIGDRDPQIGDGAAEFVGESHAYAAGHGRRWNMPGFRGKTGIQRRRVAAGVSFPMLLAKREARRFPSHPRLPRPRPEQHRRQHPGYSHRTGP